MIELTIEGLEEVEAFLQDVITKLKSETVWDLESLMGEARRFAAEISPEVTGSYKAAHRVVVSQNQVMLGIDPSARNRVTGGLVSRYAADVENRHQVYAKVLVFLNRLAAEHARIIGGNFVNN